VQVGGASERGLAEQYHLEVAAEVVPGFIARCAFGDEQGHDALVAKFAEVVPVPQDLAETEPELFFLVVVGDALDLGDKDCPAGLPGQIEVRLLGECARSFRMRMSASFVVSMCGCE
jgi:hypothetical protein